jgi:hypothetical protein
MTATRLTWRDRWDHVLARCGIHREGHRVRPGLYVVGRPTPDSPVLVTANYTLSFDALRSELAGLHGYILVLDTGGINVWCAAGKGTFGTDEIVGRVESVRLHDVVRHRVLILPQLGAPGVAAHEVQERSGFQVEYGPVRAADLPDYLSSGRATATMRRVRFGVLDRAILIPVDLVGLLIPLLLVAAGQLVFGGSWGFQTAAALLAGAVLFPLLLPWLPTRDFSTKGFILGGLVSLPFALMVLISESGTPLWVRLSWALAHLLLWPPITAFIALNFTGATTFTSRTGVRREIFRYVPIMAWLFGIGLMGSALLSWLRM